MFATAILGFAAAIVLAVLSPKIKPPYGVYIAGMGLAEWAMSLTILFMVAESVWYCYKLGRILRAPYLAMLPFWGIVIAMALVTDRARKIGMKPGLFFGPLRPLKKRA